MNDNQNPMPKWSSVLFGLFRGKDADIVQGDLEEAYRQRATRLGHSTKVRFHLFVDTIRSLGMWWHPAAVLRRWRRAAQTPDYLREGRPMPLSTLIPEVRIT